MSRPRTPTQTQWQPQVSIGGLEDPKEIDAEIEAGYLWRESLWSAMRSFTTGYLHGGLKGYDAVAAELDRRWGPKGRPVSASVLRAALHDVERNNFRAEWLDWYCARSEEIAAIVGRRVKPEKTAEQMLEDVIAELREEMAHKRVEVVLRKARAR
jgi:hypothetical protein